MLIKELKRIHCKTPSTFGLLNFQVEIISIKSKLFKDFMLLKVNK